MNIPAVPALTPQGAEHLHRRRDRCVARRIVRVLGDKARGRAADVGRAAEGLPACPRPRGRWFQAIFSIASTPWRLIGTSIAISASFTFVLIFSARAFTSGICHAAAVVGLDVLPPQKTNGFISGPSRIGRDIPPMPSSNIGVLVRHRSLKHGRIGR